MYSTIGVINDRSYIQGGRDIASATECTIIEKIVREESDGETSKGYIADGSCWVIRTCDQSNRGSEM